MFLISNKAEDGIKDNLGDLIGFLEETLREGKSLAEREVPQFIEEVLTYSMLYHSMWAAGFLLLTIAVFWYFSFKGKMNKRKFGHRMLSRELDKEDSTAVSITMVLSSMTMLAFLMAMLYHLVMILKIYVAPRIYLLEYVMEELK